MDKKLLICGTGVLLGIAFFLSAGMKVASTAEAANSRTSPLKKEHPAGERSASSRKVQAADPRTDLLAELGGIAGSADGFDHECFSSLLVKLVKIDPEAAAEFGTSLPAGPAREEALRRISQAWATEDAAGAETWAAALPDAVERESALGSICMQVAQLDAGQAILLAERHSLAAAPVTENLAHLWAAQDFPAAATWIKARPAGEQREQLVMRLALVRSATAPAEAARLVVDEIPEGHVQTEAVISVIYQWARRDMAGAREWVGLFPESALRTRAENELSNIAAYQTPEQR
ncbi:MAG: hypothetical protein EOP88_05230 [Verrucomicrobiaceae bacterium]|nr:MAG: hypothetical protein EOP88_05230 [Verrucomicrobiaceae bacterium]